MNENVDTKTTLTLNLNNNRHVFIFIPWVNWQWLLYIISWMFGNPIFIVPKTNQKTYWRPHIDINMNTISLRHTDSNIWRSQNLFIYWSIPLPDLFFQRQSASEIVNTVISSNRISTWCIRFLIDLTLVCIYCVTLNTKSCTDCMIEFIWNALFIFPHLQLNIITSKINYLVDDFLQPRTCFLFQANFIFLYTHFI